MCVCVCVCMCVCVCVCSGRRGRVEEEQAWRRFSPKASVICGFGEGYVVFLSIPSELPEFTHDVLL